jgi:hypothetical protein
MGLDRSAVCAIFLLCPEGSPGDTPVNFNTTRNLSSFGAIANVSFVGGGHRLKFGVDAFAFPSREVFNFLITDPTFNPLPDNSTATIDANGTVTFAFDPALTPEEIDEILEDFNPNLIAYDSTILEQAAVNGSTIIGTPRNFVTGPQKTGKEFSSYIQDAYTYRNFTVSGGLRFDHYSFLVTETAFSPRVGIAYSIPRSGTVLRASYNRIFQTPSTEYLLISEGPEAETLVNPRTVAIFGPDIRRMRSERSNWYEVGVQQRLGRLGRLDAAYYAKRTRDLHDNDQFLNTSVIFPISLSRGRIEGFDLRFDSAQRGGFSGYLSLGTVRAIVTPPFSGGLFLGGEPAETFGGEPFRIDHDQKLNIQSAIRYDNPQNGWFGQFQVRHDSGLVTEWFAMGGFVGWRRTFFTLLTVTLLTGWRNYAQVNREKAVAQEMQRGFWLEHGAKNPHSTAHYGIFAFKPRHTL